MAIERNHWPTPRIVIAMWLLTGALLFTTLPRMAAVTSSVTAPTPTPAPAPTLAID